MSLFDAKRNFNPGTAYHVSGRQLMLPACDRQAPAPGWLAGNVSRSARVRRFRRRSTCRAATRFTQFTRL